MDSASRTSSDAPRGVVLPSIHEMFPEHIFSRTAASFAHTVNFNHSRRSTPLPGQTFSFDVLQSHPRAASLHHIASARPAARAPMPTPQLLPVRPSADGKVDAEVDKDEEDVEEKNLKHVCPTCGKRFNRPSSLRIHANTHTGATPFICPHPGCGREFNVNSNMRRHFRNHGSASTLPRAPSKLDLPVSSFAQVGLGIGRAGWRKLEFSAYSPDSSSYSPDSAVSAGSFSTSSINSFSAAPALLAPPVYAQTRQAAEGKAGRRPYCESDARSEPP